MFRLAPKHKEYKTQIFCIVAERKRTRLQERAYKTARHHDTTQIKSIKKAKAKEVKPAHTARKMRGLDFALSFLKNTKQAWKG